MGWKQFSRDYLTFSRKERIGIIVIIFLIFFIWLSPKIFHTSRPKHSSLDTSWISASKKLRSNPTKDDENRDENSNTLVFEKSVDSKISKAELFYFEPNKATTEEWKRLGLKEKTIHTIQNYL